MAALEHALIMESGMPDEKPSVPRSNTGDLWLDDPLRKRIMIEEAY